MGKGPKADICSIHGCKKTATVRCGTWQFCTEHAVSQAKVTLDKDGGGEGIWGSAYAHDAKVIAEIRKTQKTINLGVFEYQP